MPQLPLLFAFALIAAPQVPAAANPTSAPAQNPITVQLMTVVDFPGALGGLRVRVPDVAVKYVIGPRLLVVGAPPIRGIDRRYRPIFRYDNLFVLLPAGGTLARGQVITVTGHVRSVAAARAMGLPFDEAFKEEKSGKQAEKMGNALVLVADTAESVGGTVLATGR